MSLATRFKLYIPWTFENGKSLFVVVKLCWLKCCSYTQCFCVFTNLKGFIFTRPILQIIMECVKLICSLRVFIWLDMVYDLSNYHNRNTRWSRWINEESFFGISKILCIQWSVGIFSQASPKHQALLPMFQLNVFFVDTYSRTRVQQVASWLPFKAHCFVLKSG